MQRLELLPARPFALLFLLVALAAAAGADRVVETRREVVDEDGVGTLPCMAGAPDGEAVAAWVDGGSVRVALFAADEDAALAQGALVGPGGVVRLAVAVAGGGRPTLVAVERPGLSVASLLVVDANGSVVESARLVEARPGLVCTASAAWPVGADGYCVARAFVSAVRGATHLELRELAFDGTGASATIPLGSEGVDALDGCAGGTLVRVAWRAGGSLHGAWVERSAAGFDVLVADEVLDLAAGSAPFVECDGRGTFHEAWSDAGGRLLHRRRGGPAQDLDGAPVVTPWVFGPDGVGTLPAMAGGALCSFGVDHNGELTFVVAHTGGAHRLARLLEDRQPSTSELLAPGAWRSVTDGFGNLRFAHAHATLDLGAARRATLVPDGPFLPGVRTGIALSSRGDAGRAYHVFASAAAGAIALDGRVLGLAPDALFAASVSGAAPFQGFTGVLSGDGVGTLPAVVLPPDPALSGRPLVLGFVTAQGRSGGLRTVSDLRAFVVD